MNKAFEKILDMLEEERELSYADFSRYVEEVSPCLDDEYDDFFHRGLERASRLVKEVAKEYNGGWIACSERLPEESGYYLVTYHDWSDGNFLPKYDDTYVRRLHYQISEHFVGWNYPKNVDDRAENDCHKEVIAWQPLPEPYKERD